MAEPAPTHDRAYLRSWWFAGLLVGLTILVYLPSLQAAFVFDDTHLLTTDKPAELVRLGDPITWVTVPRGLAKLSFGLNKLLLGEDPSGYRLVNVLIHALAGLLLFGIIWRLVRAVPTEQRFSGVATDTLAFAAALLWVVHPLNTQAVTYLIQRMESMAGMFYLLGLYALIRSAEPLRADKAGQMGDRWGSWLWGGLAVLAVWLGMWTKSIVVTAPVVLLVIDRTLLAGSLSGALKRRWGVYLGMCASWSLLLINGILLNILDLNASAPDRNASAGLGHENIGPLEYAMAQTGVIVHYLYQALWPQTLCIDWYYTGPESMLLEVALPTVVLVLLLGLTIWGLWRNRWWGALGAWFFLILSPTSSVIPVADLIMEHRMYLPLASVCVLVAVVAALTLKRLARSAPPLRPHLPLLSLGLIVIATLTLALRTVDRNQDYESKVSLWQATLQVRPRNPRAHHNLGKAYHDRGELTSALAHFSRTLELQPSYTQAYNGTGTVMMKLGRLEEAVSWFEQGLEIKPEDRTLNHNLARALLRLDRFDQALEHYRRALGPDGQTENAELMNDLGLAYFGLDKTDSALRWLNRAIQARPDWDDPLFNLGQVFAGLGRTDRAVACFERLMERHRPSEPAWRKYALGRARALTRGGRLEPAQRAYESLIKRAGPAPEPLAELGTVLLLRGQAPRGLSALREAYRLTPNDFRMLRRIAWVRATCPDPQIRSAREALRLGQSAYEQASRLAQSVESDRPGRDASALLYPFQDTLAAALAEAGRFEDAADLAQQAAEAAERAGKPDHQRIILQRLEAYRAKRAVRVAGPAFHPELTPPTASQAPPLAPAPAPAP